ncbi:M48 family metallopeptidase [Acetobacteraceae bacterium]|nr:M48 family metallopeptidase [Acetobacteraceae bacterium]
MARGMATPVSSKEQLKVKMKENFYTAFPWPIDWKYSTRSRRLSLRINPRTGGVVLSLPQNFPKEKALLFLKAHQKWVTAQLDALPPPAVQSNEIYIEGKIFPIVRIPALPSFLPKLYPDRLVIREHDQNESLRIEAFLKARAKTRLPASFQRWCEIMGTSPSRITLRDAKTRWGSCNVQGAIMLNWRLILAPKSVQDYVIIHELAHLTHFNHSADFWALVENFCPNGKIGRKESEKWLKKHGIKLQRTV